MKSRILSAGILVVAFFAGTAFAQEAPSAVRKVEIDYSPYGFVKAAGPTRQGGCSGVSVSATDSVALVSEFCGTHQYVSRTQVDSLLSYRGGVRFNKRTGSRITTFVQGLAGGESGYRHRGFAGNSGFSFAVGGGVDIGLMNWLGLRIVRANYQMTRVGGTTVNGFRFNPGLVFRIGKREESTK